MKNIGSAVSQCLCHNIAEIFRIAKRLVKACSLEHNRIEIPQIAFRADNIVCVAWRQEQYLRLVAEMKLPIHLLQRGVFVPSGFHPQPGIGVRIDAYGRKERPAGECHNRHCTQKAGSATGVGDQAEAPERNEKRRGKELQIVVAQMELLKQNGRQSDRDRPQGQQQFFPFPLFRSPPQQPSNADACNEVKGNMGDGPHPLVNGRLQIPRSEMKARLRDRRSARIGDLLWNQKDIEEDCCGKTNGPTGSDAQDAAAIAGRQHDEQWEHRGPNRHDFA